MLSDFLTLEVYFGHEASAQFFEDLTERYGKKPIENALKAGDLVKKKVLIGPDTGRDLVWLSEKGREKLV
jgi:hypothetical protein